MTDYIERCRDPRALARFLQDPGEGTYARIWDDGTVDVAVTCTADLSGYIREFGCPICNDPIEMKPIGISGTVRGMFVTCPDCGQRYFIHEKLPFGGTDIPFSGF